MHGMPKGRRVYILIEGGSAARCCWGERWQGASPCHLSLSPTIATPTPQMIFKHLDAGPLFFAIASNLVRCVPVFALLKRTSAHKGAEAPFSDIFQNSSVSPFLRKTTLCVLRVSPKARALATIRSLRPFFRTSSHLVHKLRAYGLTWILDFLSSLLKPINIGLLSKEHFVTILKMIVKQKIYIIIFIHSF